MTHDAYLESQVLTATPQKLRLLLIEGALRFARHALTHWDDEQRAGEIAESVSRCRSIVAELAATVKTHRVAFGPNVVAVYLFLFKTLLEVQIQNHRAKLEDVIRVLEVEQETWRQVCDVMPEPPHDPDEPAVPEVTAGDLPAIAPVDFRDRGTTGSSGLSFEA